MRNGKCYLDWLEILRNLRKETKGAAAAAALLQRHIPAAHVRKRQAWNCLDIGANRRGLGDLHFEHLVGGVVLESGLQRKLCEGAFTLEKDTVWRQ